ncbi:MAG: hypothetical protein JOZ69_19230 [Myxococcales bacterium]|nr:hypothetical protein [Myxococcales bacterium]
MNRISPLAIVGIWSFVQNETLTGGFIAGAHVEPASGIPLLLLVLEPPSRGIVGMPLLLLVLLEPPTPLELPPGKPVLLELPTPLPLPPEDPLPELLLLVLPPDAPLVDEFVVGPLLPGTGGPAESLLPSP